MPEQPIALIYQHIPHQSVEYFQVGELLLKTVQCGNYEELKILLSVRSVDVNYRSLTTGQTALMHCSSAKIAELLLLHGADPNLQNRMGNTALHFGVAGNNFELCQTLLDWGAMKRIKNHCAQGITPCQIPANKNLINLIQSRKCNYAETIIWPSVFPRSAPSDDVLSIDFEMIGIVNPSWGHHVMIDFPVEVGIVDSKLNTIYHTKCRPDFLPITGTISNKVFRKMYSPPVDHFLDRPSIDLRTRITGIRPGELDTKPLASQVLAEVRQIIQGKFLVGHAIEHDLLVLQHFGPPFQGIRDTSQFLRWKGKKISLKKAASIYLSKNIQTGKHSALEDATTTMELYLLLRDEWEQSDEPFLLPPNQIRQVLHDKGDELNGAGSVNSIMHHPLEQHKSQLNSICSEQLVPNSAHHLNISAAPPAFSGDLSLFSSSTCQQHTQFTTNNDAALNPGFKNLSIEE